MPYAAGVTTGHDGDFRAGRVEQARATFYRYLPPIRYESQPGLNLTLRKLICTIRGRWIILKHAAPYQRLDDTTLLELEALLAHLGLDTSGCVRID